MIARLAGTLIEKGPEGLVVDVGGVGYQVFVSLQTLANFPAVGEPVQLYVYTHVREDAIQLFGFRELAERRLFLLLKEVSGIGPRLALNILSGLPVDDLAEAIREGDVGRLVAIPGVGRKTAERIVVELRDKIGQARDARLAGGDSGLVDQAVSALVNLGYRKNEAERAVRAALGKDAMALEDVIRTALRGLAP